MEIKSKVPLLVRIKKWSAYELGKRGGFAPDTAARLTRGDTNFNINTLNKLCKIFEVKSVSEIIEIEPEQKE